jgi:hypothetical protein
MYFWIQKLDRTVICKNCQISPNTATKWKNKLQELITTDFDDDDDKQKNMIGGEGIIVEIDESKFSKRKYHRGKRVNGVWVVGGVERTEERRMFAATVLKRDEPTLTDVIRRFVLPGSTIYTDCWKAYKFDKENISMRHYTVNHSENYKETAPDGTVVHTNTIEGTWNGIKLSFAPSSRRKDDISGKLLEFIWCRKNEGHLWERLIYLIKTIKYD